MKLLNFYYSNTKYLSAYSNLSSMFATHFSLKVDKNKNC